MTADHLDDDTDNDLKALPTEPQSSGKGPTDARRSSMRRRAPALIAAAAVFLAAVGVLLWRQPSDPAADLAKVIGFVAAQKTVRINATVVSTSGSGGEVGSSYTDRSRVTGEAQLPDAVRLVQQSEYGAHEYLRVRDAAYSRWAEDLDALAREPWVEEKAAIEESAHATGSLGDVVGLMATLDAGFDPAALLRQLEGATLVEPGVLRASATLGDLLPRDVQARMVEEYERFRKEVADNEESDDADERLSDGGDAATDDIPTVAEILATQYEFTLHHAIGGRLDRLVVVAEATGEGPFGTFHTTTDMQFSAWGEPVDIAAPAEAEIDATPHIDEEGLATAAFPLLVPRGVPDGWGLSLAEVAPADPEHESCATVNLQWTPLEEVAPIGVFDEPPTLEVLVTDAACPWADEALPSGGGMVRVGPRAMTVVRDLSEYPLGYLSEGTGLVFDEGGARYAIASNLPEAELLRLASDLVPFDLSGQRIHPQGPAW